MKKTISLILSAIMLLTLLPSCGNRKTDGRINIVTTIFPVYDWVRQIVGENSDVNVTMLLDNGVDLHSFQPTAEDIIKITTSDLFVYIGGESDEWTETVLSGGKVNTLNLMDTLGELKKEEVQIEIPGEKENEEDGETEYDEHIWLSLKNAAVLIKALGEKLSPLCGEDALKSAEEYISEIKKLDGEFAEMTKSAKRKTLLFADRFPFMYLTDDYGLDYYAAFSGCSAESEASFETVTFLAGKIDELNLTAVVTLEGSKAKIAETVIGASSNKNCKTVTLNSMQSVTAKDVSAGVTYTEIMKENLASLKAALN